MVEILEDLICPTPVIDTFTATHVSGYVVEFAGTVSDTDDPTPILARSRINLPIG